MCASVLAALPAAGRRGESRDAGQPGPDGGGPGGAARGIRGPLVVDPVLATSSGHRLFDGQPDDLAPLLARATLVTPNVGEAAALANQMVSDTGERPARGRTAATAGRGRGAGQGRPPGRRGAPTCCWTPRGRSTLAAPRVPGKDPRGTGCALATAIATELARGPPAARGGGHRQALAARAASPRPSSATAPTGCECRRPQASRRPAARRVARRATSPLRTARPSALRVPTSTTRRLPRVTAVYSRFRCNIT